VTGVQTCALPIYAVAGSFHLRHVTTGIACNAPLEHVSATALQSEGGPQAVEGDGISKTSGTSMDFDLHIGIDYSGAETPRSRLPGLQVYAATGSEPTAVRTPIAADGKRRHWSRQEIADWLVDLVKSGRHFIAGIDHGFSFPSSYFQRYGLMAWDAFLDDFRKHWPTDEPDTYVEFVRARNPQRIGNDNEFRLTEQWTSSEKSVFHFDDQGQVAKSTHAGIPWLRYIRKEVGGEVHFWPFDGWNPSVGKSVISEVYPSIFRNRFARGKRTDSQQDAYCIARWLWETDEGGFLDRYFDPPLPEASRRIAALEGWILGIS
jgi:hypothetical protein